MAQGHKPTGMQSWLLSMVGGVEGLQRTVRDLLGGVDPITVFNELQAAFTGMGNAINAGNQRLDRIERQQAAILAALDAGGRSDRGSGADLAVVAGIDALAGTTFVAVADSRGGADRPAAANGAGGIDADPALARQQP